MYASNLIPTINCPTRVTDHTATAINNIYTTNKNMTNFSIIYYDITDHLVIIILIIIKFILSRNILRA